MNFFQAQDNARKKTWLLAMLFGAAVITLLLLTNLFVAVAFGWAGMQTGMTFGQTLAQVPIDSWIWISLGVIGVIGVASLYKFLSISGGGKTIAEALGGSLIHQSTTDQKQRQLLNVVEEMALAAGMPVPPVYLIPEPSINAFAAGFSTDDAVIGINQGTLEQLSRSELQGVVAHEFSHILNGDTHINLRLIAILHGILFVGMIGYGLLRAGGFSRRNGLPIVVAGIGLLIIGYGGTFFGNLIKAAVSRQREYLAEGVPGRRQRRAVHPRPQQHRRCVEEDRRVQYELTHDQPRGGTGQPYVFWRGGAEIFNQPVSYPPATRQTHPRHRTRLGWQVSA